MNIIDIISDTMYSDSEMIMDSLAEFLETLLRRQTEDTKVFEAVNIAGSLITAHGILNSTASPLQNLEQSLNTELLERQTILCEIVSAIGMQRFRFNDRLANGKNFFHLPSFR